MPLTKEEYEKLISNGTNHSILNYTFDEIKDQINTILQKIHLPKDLLKSYIKKLKNYRYINNLDDIVIGNYIRWIRIDDPNKLVLTNGAFICDINISDETMLLQCKNSLK